MHSVIRTLLTGCLLLVSTLTGLAHARQDDLYSVRVGVEDQSAGARYEALQEGLRRVLVKVTGDSRIDRSVLPRANRELEDFVSEYLYQPPLEPEHHESGVDLVARFMPQSIERLVRNAGLPVWPSNRPRVLVWLVADSSDGPRHLSAAEVPGLERALQDTFAARAVTMRQPLLDLEDQFILPPEEAWMLEPELLQQVSQRYGSPVILLIRLQPPAPALEWLAHPDLVDAGLLADEVPELPADGSADEDLLAAMDGSEASSGESWAAGTWGSEWLLLSDDKPYREATAPGELATVMVAGVNSAIDTLARSQAYRPSEAGGELEVRMEVRDLLTFEDFHRAEALVRGMEMVQDLQLVALERDKAHFELVVKGGSEVFLQSLRNSRHFTSLSGQTRQDEPRASASTGDIDPDAVLDASPEGGAPFRSLQFSWVP